uniref:SUEL-type lectin domain-containing protein n=1 Tax=Sphaeramia orbicularis TaxID=375764 RepID=A0A672YY19_9TELE
CSWRFSLLHLVFSILFFFFSYPHPLWCLTDEGVISVQTALYGRADSDTCGTGKAPEEVANTACALDGALDVLKTRCNGKTWCEVSPDVFDSDPCSDTFKYLESTYSCVPATHLVVCEHSLAHLRCDEGQVISVCGADYGRRDHETCSFRRDAAQIQNTDCSHPTNKVAESCDGKRTCTMRASDSVFGEPCPNTTAYLELAYTCQSPTTPKE